MKYSDKYKDTVKITSGGVEFDATKTISELYEKNEEFDNSILYTSSDFYNNMKLFPYFLLNKVITNIVDRTTRKIKELENTNIKLGVCFAYQGESTSNFVTIWGNLSQSQSIIGSNIRFIKNIDINKYLIYIRYNNISNTIENIVNDTAFLYQQHRDIEFYYYYYANNKYNRVYIAPCLAIYDNDKIYAVLNIRALLYECGYNFIYYNNLSQLREYPNSLLQFTNNENIAVNFAILPNGTELSNIDVPIGDNLNIYSDNNIVVDTGTYGSGSSTAFITYYKQKPMIEFLSGLGLYFTSYQMTATSYTTNLDTLIASGEIYLGEMIDGRTTGRFLHNTKDIYTAENYDINSENEKYNPTGDAEKDNIENMLDFSYFNYGIGGFNRYYIMTKEELETLSNEITTSETIPEGLNVFENIVEVQAIPLELSDFTSFTVKENIKIGNWTTTTQANKLISEQTFNTLCSYKISRKYNDFRDFTPYSQYQLYLPMFGIIQLPDTVVNRTLIVKRNNNITQGVFQYLICLADDTGNIDIIDRITVKCTSSIEFSAENTAIKKISILQNQLSTVNSVVSGISSIASQNVFGVANSITNIANSIISTDVAKNQNYITHNSTNTSIASLHDVDSIYLVINYSTFINDANHGHTKGFVYNKSDTLGSHSGYCVCNNVDIKINATDTENEMIKNILEFGFYI